MVYLGKCVCTVDSKLSCFTPFSLCFTSNRRLCAIGIPEEKVSLATVPHQNEADAKTAEVWNNNHFGKINPIIAKSTDKAVQHCHKPVMLQINWSVEDHT